MNVNSIIVERIELDGTLKSFQFNYSDKIGPLYIATIDEYEEEHDAPFHFLNPKYEKEFSRACKKCVKRKLGSSKFEKLGNDYYIRLTWENIPTAWSELTYYSLTLPEFAVPRKVNIFTLYNKDVQCRRSVIKDKQNNNYIIYLPCKSSKGSFSFELECDFIIDESEFRSKQYNDRYVSRENIDPNLWVDMLPVEEKTIVKQFFLGGNIFMGDIYKANQAVGMGKNVKIDTVNFKNKVDDIDIDLIEVRKELQVLLNKMKEQASETDNFIELGKIAEAQKAAEEGNKQALVEKLKTLGKWTLNVATNIGSGLLVEIIKKSMGY